MSDKNPHAVPPLLRVIVQIEDTPKNRKLAKDMLEQVTKALAFAEKPSKGLAIAKLEEVRIAFRSVEVLNPTRN